MRMYKQKRSIFGHGTFVRREYVKHSDIDITVIVYTNKDIPVIDAFCRSYKQLSGGACLSAKARSLEELKTGALAVKNKPGPKKLIRLLKTYELIWGKPLIYDELISPSKPINDLKGLITFILSHENEYRGIKQPFSYQAIKKQCPPQSLQYQAVLVWETSGEYVPKDFEQKVFADLRKQMVELSEETSR